MPVIRNIELYIPKQEWNWAFVRETRCMAFLYGRLLPKLNTDDYKGIQILCLENMEEKQKLDVYDHLTFDYFPVFVSADVRRFFELSDADKKQTAAALVHEGLIMAAEELGWHTAVFDEIFQQIKDLNYQNIYPLIKKSSPNRKYVCRIMCHHEVHGIDVYMELAKRNGRVIKSEKLFSSDYTDEQFLLQAEWSLVWRLNHKIEFANDTHEKIWRLTFLEKEKPEELVWRMQREEQSQT
ncbi:hypothetical protein SLL00_11470 [Metabacillus indicus]|uniref:hypothetical protein n=1 Tax=Metabacillus indicus TaxID=246786 RepID=UPI002A02CD7C|nr:hypothetical protein [Metabacillus indicus]MDX8290418.1 hypothetical protein [Metabacillus indicus]